MKLIKIFVLYILGTHSYAQLSVQNIRISTTGSCFSNGMTVTDFIFGETYTSNFSLGMIYYVKQGFQQPFVIKPDLSLNKFSIDGFDEYSNSFRAN
jgi:hypothetical protein